MDYVLITDGPGDKVARDSVFNIEHRSGKKHINVDSLSRIPECSCYDDITVLIQEARERYFHSVECT